MGLLGRLFRRTEIPPTADRIVLAVLYVRAQDGLSEKEAAAIRKIIIDAQPVDFHFLNPGSFQLFFGGTEEGILLASQLAGCLKRYAHENGISHFGTGLRIGECTLVTGKNDGFSRPPPTGMAVSEAMRDAINKCARK